MSHDDRDPLSPAEEQWLDRMLKAAEPVEPSAAVRRAIAEIPLRHPLAAAGEGRVSGFGAWPASLVRFALFSALASIGVGAWLGYEADVLPEVAWSDQGEASQPEDEWEELALLAFADELDEELAP